MNNLPQINTMLIGADRSGSTWINFHFCLQHPDIFFIPIGQKNFYSHEYSKGIFRSPRINWDRTGLTDESIVLGRRNIKSKHSKAIPKLLHAENNNMKFIYIMRNPVDRCFSSFSVNYAVKHRANKHQTFDINKDVKLKNCRIEYSFHFELLKKYFGYFPQENFFFMTIEQVRQDPQSWFDQLCLFLGIKTGIPLTELETHANQRKGRNYIEENTFIPPTPEFSRKIANICKEDAKIMSEISGLDLIKIWNLDDY